MSKRKPNDDGPRIVITTGDDLPEANSTLISLLRDGERPKPGEPGTLANRLGHEVQAFFAEQQRVARHVRRAVKGSVTLTISVATGPDGSQGYTVESKVKGAKIPAGGSMVFTDEDGEITGRPVEPLTELAYERERKTTTPADPKVGAASKL